MNVTQSRRGGYFKYPWSKQWHVRRLDPRIVEAAYRKCSPEEQTKLRAQYRHLPIKGLGWLSFLELKFKIQQHDEIQQLAKEVRECHPLDSD